METTVTARMAQGKKDAANGVFAQLGTNASRAINDFYSYVISHQSLPDGVAGNAGDISEQRLREAIEWVDSLSPSAPDGHFATMTDEDIRGERLASRGLL